MVGKSVVSPKENFFLELFHVAQRTQQMTILLMKLQRLLLTIHQQLQVILQMIQVILQMIQVQLLKLHPLQLQLQYQLKMLQQLVVQQPQWCLKRITLFQLVFQKCT